MNEVYNQKEMVCVSGSGSLMLLEVVDREREFKLDFFSQVKVGKDSSVSVLDPMHLYRDILKNWINLSQLPVHVVHVKD